MRISDWSSDVCSSDLLVHDEDALDVELHATRLLAIPEIERRACGHVQQRSVFERAFDLVMRVRERRLVVVRQLLVELGVLLVLELGLWPRPERARLLDGLGLALVVPELARKAEDRTSTRLNSRP